MFVCLSLLECPANYSSSFDAMGYPRVPMASLWPNGGNKPNWGKIWAKKIFSFKKIPYVIPSALLSFLPYYCHSFRIFVIPSVLKVFDSQGYLWLPYHLTKVIKLFGVTFKQKIYFFSKKYFMSFLPHYCHSFRIIVIPSVLVSFLPNIVIPSELLFRELQILNSSKSFPYLRGKKNGHRRWLYMRVIHKLYSFTQLNLKSILRI